MAKEYCKVLLSKGNRPRIFSRDLTSANVASFRAMFPELEVETLAEISSDVTDWLVCTNIESHEDVCSRLEGNIYCEKPYAHSPTYDTARDIYLLMNRRYYYWVPFMKGVMETEKIVKIIATIPERSVDALITQSIHVMDLLWYLAGPFGPATRIGSSSPSFFLSNDSGVPLVINMNYGSHENFSIRFYADDGRVHEAKPLEMFSIAEGMEVREADDEIPVRSYRPIIRPLEYEHTPYKPGLGELIDDLIQGGPGRLPSLSEHRRIHVWMQENMT